MCKILFELPMCNSMCATAHTHTLGDCPDEDESKDIDIGIHRHESMRFHNNREMRTYVDRKRLVTRGELVFKIVIKKLTDRGW